jgi:hypothetical protein
MTIDPAVHARHLRFVLLSLTFAALAETWRVSYVFYHASDWRSLSYEGLKLVTILGTVILLRRQENTLALRAGIAGLLISLLSDEALMQALHKLR